MQDIGGFLAAFVVFGVAGALVLHLAEADREREDSAGGRSGLAIWLLAFFHANTVASAAYTDVGRLSLPHAPMLTAGLLVAAAGWLLFMWATIELVRHGAFSGLHTTHLVTSGPFRFSRHPQSLGWALLLLGVTIASQSIIALVLVAAFALFAARYARIEDAELSARFGEAFETYRRQTPSTVGSP